MNLLEKDSKDQITDANYSLASYSFEFLKITRFSDTYGINTFSDLGVGHRDVCPIQPNILHFDAFVGEI